MSRHQINYKEARFYFLLLLFIEFTFCTYAENRDPEQDKAKFTRFKKNQVFVG